MSVLLRHPAGRRNARRVRERREELVRGTPAIDPSVLQDHDLVGDLQNALLVGNDDDRAVADLAAHLAEDLDEVLEAPEVDPRLGLVEDRQFRAPRDHRRDLDALEFPARETVVYLAVDILLRAQPDLRKHLARLRDRRVLSGRESEQIEDADPLEADRILKRERDPRASALGDVFIRNVLAVEEDRTRRRALDPRDQFGERRFPAAVRSRDDQQFPCGNGQGNVPKDLFFPVVFGHGKRHVFDFQHARTSHRRRLRIPRSPGCDPRQKRL